MRALRSAYASPRRWALALDLVLVVVFAIIGRASHSELLSFGGIVGTAWPFVVACLAGWLVVTLASLRHGRPWPAGVIIWAITVAGGMLLRVATGDTAATAFIVVASITLAIFLLVPRLVLGLGPGSETRRGAARGVAADTAREAGRDAGSEPASDAAATHPADRDSLTA